MILMIGFATLEKDPEIEIGDELMITVKGNLMKIEDVDNFDGTIDRKYKVKLITVDKIEKTNG